MGDAIDTTKTIGLTAEIVSAYVGNNTWPRPISRR